MQLSAQVEEMMHPVEKLQRENDILRERLSRMGSAFQRINESLDFETVLQGVLDSARSLTDAKYGLLSVLEDGRRIQNCIPSGLTRRQVRQLRQVPENEALFEHFAFVEGPLRLGDMHSHARRLGLPDFHPPMPVRPKLTCLVAPIRHREERVGTFFLVEKEAGRAFTEEDEETLVTFAAQAALVITNARRYRDERRAVANLETLIDTAPVGVVVQDAKRGRPVSFNREALRIAGSLLTDKPNPEHLLQTLIVRRADGSEFSLKEFPIVEVLGTGETVRAEEVTMKVPDGRSVTAIVNATPNRSESGRLESVVVTLQDMAPLEELERLRAEFLAIVSHELRAPLAAIAGSASTALRDTFPYRQAEMVQFLRIISEHAERMGVMINDLLDVARIETGTLVVDPVPVTVTRLLDKARNTFLSGSNRDNVHIDLAPGLPPVIADPGRITQVLVNLLANAAQNSPEASPILLTALQEDGNLTICVTDKGGGLSPERMPHLFRKFSRRDGGTDSDCDAQSGWGLSICRGIVEAHGGRIWAECDGEGTETRFKFSIPIADGVADVDTRRSGVPMAGSRSPAKGRAKILAIDDDPQTLRSIRKTLLGAGFDPVVTGEPGEAPQLVDEHKPRLVLLDLVLPGSDGIELMRKIIEKADVPVMFLSAYGHEDAIVRAFDNGATDYVVKPFSPSELTARIRAILRNRTPSGHAMPSEPFVMGDLKIDYARRRVTVAGKPLDLTRIEYLLLQDLSICAGRTVPHEDLLKRVWGRTEIHDRRPVHAAVKKIRRKLGDSAKSPTYVFNESGVGYRLGAAE